MTRVRYDIVPSAAGWRIACNGVVGPPYAQQADAISDTLFIADQLETAGQNVAVRILELDGPHQVWRGVESASRHFHNRK
jgi:hypothetical protein